MTKAAATTTVNVGSVLAPESINPALNTALLAGPCTDTELRLPPEKAIQGTAVQDNGTPDRGPCRYPKTVRPPLGGTSTKFQSVQPVPWNMYIRVVRKSRPERKVQQFPARCAFDS